MDRCDSFQQQAELARRGLLDLEQQTALKAHMTGCDDCRRAESLAAAASLALVPNATPPPEYRLVAALARDRFWLRWAPWAVIVAFSIQGAFISWLLIRNHWLASWLMTTAAGALLALGMVVENWQRRRAAVDAGRLGLDAWAQARRSAIERQLHSLRQLRWGVPLLGGLFALTGWLLPEEAGAGRMMLWAVAFSMPLLLVWFLAQFEPELRRELAVLGPRP